MIGPWLHPAMESSLSRISSVAKTFSSKIFIRERHARQMPRSKPKSLPKRIACSIQSLNLASMGLAQWKRRQKNRSERESFSKYGYSGSMEKER
mmetsp:Transcript_14001/g.23752  ORF Transcript_14001/g.23752 Transcript_14001/m.23752 type:complete len:94 (-) Transcript_14001:180-461(-)